MTAVLMLVLALVAPQRVYVDGQISPPEIVCYTDVFYTRAARDTKIEGTITVEATFDANAKANVLRTVTRLGYGLDESALTALKSWTFTPALRNGAPVETIGQIEIDFKLADAPPAEFDDVEHVRPGVSTPTVLKRVEPQYTPESRALGIVGTVVLQAVVQADGTAKIVKVVKPLNLDLTESAIQAIEQWKFRPGMRDGKEVPVSVNVEVNFNLERRQLTPPCRRD